MLEYELRKLAINTSTGAMNVNLTGRQTINSINQYFLLPSFTTNYANLPAVSLTQSNSETAVASIQKLYELNDDEGRNQTGSFLLSYAYKSLFGLPVVDIMAAISGDSTLLTRYSTLNNTTNASLLSVKISSLYTNRFDSLRSKRTL